ncbi:MAG: dimethylsulfonioproprionate lyase family protein [Actinomycetota bacterium]
MTFASLLAEAVATTRLLAVNAASVEAEAVAKRADAHRGLAPTRPGQPCPLEGASALIDDEPFEGATALLDLFRTDIDELCWFRSSSVPSDFVTQSAAAELLGPDGAVETHELRFGFFLIGPHADYVRHWHAAEELYMVLSGGAEWNLDDGWRRRSAGDIVRVPSMTPHAIRTSTSPVLMLYSWTGNLTFDTYGY